MKRSASAASLDSSLLSLLADRRKAVFVHALLLSERPPCKSLHELVDAGDFKTVQLVFRRMFNTLKPEFYPAFTSMAGQGRDGVPLSVMLLGANTPHALRALFANSELNFACPPASNVFARLLSPAKESHRRHASFPSVLLAMLSIYNSTLLHRLNQVNDSTYLAALLRHGTLEDLGYIELVVSHFAHITTGILEQSHAADDLITLCIERGFYRLLMAFPPTILPHDYSRCLAACASVTDKQVLEAIFTQINMSDKLWALLEAADEADLSGPLKELRAEILATPPRFSTWSFHFSWKTATRKRLWEPLQHLEALQQQQQQQQQWSETAFPAILQYYEQCKSYFSPVVVYPTYSHRLMSLMQNCLLRSAEDGGSAFRCVELPPSVTPWMAVNSRELWDAARIVGPQALSSTVTWLREHGEEGNVFLTGLSESD